MNAADEATLFPIEPDEPFKVLIERPVLGEMVSEAEGKQPPQYFVLLGSKTGKKDEPIFNIREIRPVGGDGGRGLTVFSKETVLGFRRELAAEHPGYKILGWATVHETGKSPSPREEDTHRFFFAEPWNLFLVLDGEKKDATLFRFEDGALRESLLRVVPRKKAASPRTREHKHLLEEIEKLKSEKKSLEKALETKKLETFQSMKTEKILRAPTSEEKKEELFARPISTRGDAKRQSLKLASSIARKQGKTPREYAANDKVIQLPLSGEEKGGEVAQESESTHLSGFGKRMLYLAATVLLLLIAVAIMNIISEHAGGRPSLNTPSGVNNEKETEEPGETLMERFNRESVPDQPRETEPEPESRDREMPNLGPIPPRTEERTRPEPAPRVYVVKKGDNPWTIAKKTLGDGRLGKKILDYNGLSEKTVLRIGQKLKIPPR